eukprot:14461186-Ditylum_brightwellii.AAC.1
MLGGRYTAVIDISKMLYKFPVAEEDRKYLGLIHPKLGIHLRYSVMPMGGSSSPGLAGQDMSDVIKITESNPMFYEEVCINLITTHYNGGDFDPSLPKDNFLITSNGTPVLVTWMYINFFMIYAATYTECCAATAVALGILTRLGLLASRAKVKITAQMQCFCGF